MSEKISSCKGIEVFEFDAMISVEAESRAVAEGFIFELCTDADIAISLFDAGVLNVSRLSSEVRDAFEWAWSDGRYGRDEGGRSLHDDCKSAWDTYDSPDLVLTRQKETK